MFNLILLLKTAGYLGLFSIIFAESSIVFFLPGDSLLFTAGILASQQYLNITAIVALALLGAIGGNIVAYWLGRHFGTRLFTSDHSLIFNKKYIARARDFYAAHGQQTIILARFLPIVRTFAPIIAGIGEMRYRTFVLYTAVGGVLWAAGLPLAGYYLGRIIPNIDHYLIPIIIAIVIISFIPPLVGWRKRK